MSEARAYEYRLLSGADPTSLTDAVNKVIAVGWQPLGGASVVIYGFRERCYQAVIRMVSTDLHSHGITGQHIVVTDDDPSDIRGGSRS
jgi:hypothetical protein